MAIPLWQVNHLGEIITSNLAHVVMERLSDESKVYNIELTCGDSKVTLDMPDEKTAKELCDSINRDVSDISIQL